MAPPLYCCFIEATPAVINPRHLHFSLPRSYRLSLQQLWCTFGVLLPAFLELFVRLPPCSVEKKGPSLSIV